MTPQEAVARFFDSVGPADIDLGKDLGGEQADLRRRHSGVDKLGDVVTVQHRFRDFTKIWGDERRRAVL